MTLAYPYRLCSTGLGRQEGVNSATFWIISSSRSQYALPAPLLLFVYFELRFDSLAIGQERTPDTMTPADSGVHAVQSRETIKRSVGVAAEERRE